MKPVCRISESHGLWRNVCRADWGFPHLFLDSGHWGTLGNKRTQTVCSGELSLWWWMQTMARCMSSDITTKQKRSTSEGGEAKEKNKGERRVSSWFYSQGTLSWRRCHSSKAVKEVGVIYTDTRGGNVQRMHRPRDVVQLIPAPQLLLQTFPMVRPHHDRGPRILRLAAGGNMPQPLGSLDHPWKVQSLPWYFEYKRQLIAAHRDAGGPPSKNPKCK